MEIYLIRHTTPKIIKGICYGQSDIPLEGSFEEEAKNVLKQVNFDANTVVYSSPLKRCKLLAEKFSKDVVLDNRLLELNFGDWELKAWDAIPDNELNPWMEDFVHNKPSNGESYMALSIRSVDFLTEIMKKQHQKVIIVTHSGVIRSILAYVKNIELKDSFKEIKIEYSDVFKLVKTEKLRIIEAPRHSEFSSESHQKENQS